MGKIINVIVGTIIAIIGIAICSIDYFILKAIWGASAWFAGLFAAPGAVTIIIALFVSIWAITAIFLPLIVGGLFIYFGYKIASGK